MGNINFINKTHKNMNIWKEKYRRYFNFACEYLKLKNEITISILFVTQKYAKKINEKYRNKDYIPDVISFPTNIPEEIMKDIAEYDIGDIMICKEVAEDKSKRYGTTLDDEMAFLIIHGLLHLLGYDHENDLEEQEKMFKLQNEILKKCGINYEIKFDEKDYLMHYGE
ncbi:rRNA maturation RNase YbeY [Spiroplasma endosymbiont of Labia minor]|uniref:rRNA maturation RNase YbeY n=1 Tax=Spiroplasma endosymbiont of Labia minor TaxID=3066305 RepID=UPI0030CF6328